MGVQSNTEIFTEFTKNDIKIHEKYDSVEYLNDIALIKLKRNTNSWSTTNTLCIPFDEKETPKNLSMGEWDVDDIIVSNPKIKETHVSGIDNVKCGHEFLNFVEVIQQRAPSYRIPEENNNKSIKSKEIRFEQFCADKKCKKLFFLISSLTKLFFSAVKSGNSGMPVYGNDLKTGAPTIYGLVSYGAKLGHGLDVPTVFTKIYDYRHWILCHAY